MREQVLSILRRARRRLLATRAAESAATVATATGIWAAGVQLAWAVAGASAWPGKLLCLALAVAWAPAVLVGRLRRRLVALAGSQAMAVTMALAGECLALGGYLAIDGGLHRRWPGGVVSLLALPAAALAAAAVELLRGVTLRHVAEYLDARGSLRERMATAAELALADRPVPASAQAVYAQAVGAAEGGRLARLPMWGRTRATAGALLLSVILCAATGLLPRIGPSARHTNLRRLGESLPALTADQRRELAGAFRRAAEQAASDPELARQLARAAAVVEVKDAQELQRILEQLQSAGFEPVSIVPQGVLAAAGLPGQGSGPGDGPAADDRPPPRRPDANLWPQAAGGGVRVYHPQYASADVRPADANADTPPAAGTIPYADAWAHARARATDALTRGRVPSEYRRLVHDFFADPQ